MESLQGAALNLCNYRHFSEHLAPICILLNIPLLLSEIAEAEFLEKIYPGLKTEVWHREAVSLSRLFETFPLWIQSEYWPRKKWEEAKIRYGNRFQKQHNLHCPHGFSDKRFWLAQAAQEEGTLYYGPLMQTWLQEEGMEEKRQIWCGHYRACYYQKYRHSMDVFFQENVLSRFAKKQFCILYAPTCLDQELSTTFLEAKDLLDHLPSEYNLLVKLHPALVEKAPWEVEELIVCYSGRPNLLILDQFPLVYPILQHVDVYVGDVSSMGYDFLRLGKPMFFLKNRQNRTPRLLEGAGFSLPVEKASLMYSLLDKQPERSVQKDLDQQAFGPTLSWEELSSRLTRQITTWFNVC